MSVLSIILAIFVVILIIIIYLSYRKIIHGKVGRWAGVVSDAWNGFGKTSKETDIKKETTINDGDSAADLILIDYQPIHLGIIPDGNRRWRKKENVDLEKFIEHITNILRSMYEKTNDKEISKYRSLVRELSIYGLSADNIMRNDDTLEMIETCLKRIIASNDIPWGDIKVQFIGKEEIIPQKISTICKMIEQKCAGNFVISIALGYDPIEDSKRFLGTPGDDASANRPIQSPIDLVIRTGGEKRSSGFFPLHTTYSEWIYTKKLFPDITMTDIDSFIKEFYSRKRNFGK